MLSPFVDGVLSKIRDQSNIFANFRIYIILIILIMAALLGVVAKPGLLEIIVVAVVGLLFLIIFLRRLEWLLLLLVPASFFLPIEVATGTNVRLNITVVLSILYIAFWFSRLILTEKAISLKPSIVNQPAIVFIIATTLSLIIGNLIWFIKVPAKASISAQLGGWALYVVSIIVFLVVGNQIRSLDWLKKIVNFYIIISALPFILLLIPFVRDYVTQIYVPVSLTCLTRLWVTALAFGQLLWRQNTTHFEKFGLALCSFAPFIQSWLYDREYLSGWLPALIAIYVLAWLRSRKWGIALTIFGLLLVATNSQSLITSVMSPTQQYSTESRMATWPIMFKLIKVSPIFGTGLANYPYYTHLYRIYNYYIRFNSHNNYLDILAQTGIIGFLSFSWLAINIGRLGLRLRDKVSDSFSQGYVNGVIAGLVSTLSAGFMADWFLPFLYNIGFPGFRASLFAWIFLGGLISLEHMIDNTKNIKA